MSVCTIFIYNSFIDLFIFYFRYVLDLLKKPYHSNIFWELGAKLRLYCALVFVFGLNDNKGNFESLFVDC